MKSYKLRKSSEVSLFPIESELRLLRQENDNLSSSFFNKIISVVFSGIGTTLFSQKNFIPLWSEMVARFFSKDVEKWTTILQIVITLLVFIILPFLAYGVLYAIKECKDNKKEKRQREDLAEFFHKIILNNIITGVSFANKAEAKNIEYEELLRKGPQKDTECVDEIRRDCGLYMAEAIYYFELAKKQMEAKQIVELGNRKKYMQYVEEIGALGLFEALSLYENSTGNLQKLLIKIQESREDTAGDLERKCIIDIRNKVEKIREYILPRFIDFKDTLMKNEIE